MLHIDGVPLRILAYLTLRQAPAHYATIAKHLGYADPREVLRRCNRMAHDGTLHWCGEGMYAVPGAERPQAPCACTIAARCGAAWDLRDALDALPMDGTAQRLQDRLDVIRAYESHMRQAGFSYFYVGSLAAPLWSPREYRDPRKEA